MICNFARVRRTLALSLVFATACKDNGPGAGLEVAAGANQTVAAGTIVPTPIQVLVRGSNGDPAANETVTFTITAGGGSFVTGGTTAQVQTASNGIATAPGWRVGKSDIPQIMRATAAGMTKDDITVNILSLYEITIRFFGDPMTAAQQALFTNAAARLSAIVTGDLIDADARGGTINPNTSCQGAVSGQPNLNEIIDDVLIYASIDDIDGPGQILAQAGPCLVRPHPATGSPPHTAVGAMQFDIADLASLSGSGSLQDVITHEMLHVLGFGTIWGSPRNFLQGGGTADPRYIGAQGIEGCRTIGGSIACAISVPVENTGGEGTSDSHWRESTFNTELMTGFLDAGSNPISRMTVGALADLGFTVNASAADDYTIFLNALRANAVQDGPRARWENIIRPIGVLEFRTVRPLRQ